MNARLVALKSLMYLVRLEWPMRVASPLMGDYDPFRADTRYDPYASYAALRRSAPVHYHRMFGAWILTRYDDIAQVLRDPTMSVDRTQLGDMDLLPLSPKLIDALKVSLLMQDPPRHTRLRSLVNKAFTPRVVERLRPRIAAIVEELLDAAERRGETSMDFVEALAYPLPVIVIAELLGIPSEDREQFKRWSDDLAVILDPFSTGGRLDGVERSFQEAATYFADIFAARRRNPTDDLVSALVHAEIEGERLSEIELLSVCLLLLGAGHETTTGLLSNGLLALLRHPSELRRLADDPSLAPRAVEELLRYDAPVQMTDRVVTRDVTLRGKTLKKGEQVVLMLAAGNRDPSRFEAPDRLDIARDDARSLAFGHGAHYCVGAALARVEAEVALTSLLARFPSLRLAAAPVARDYKVSMVLRGLTTLRVAY